MRLIIIILPILLSLSSCSKSFFDFDEVIHYNIEYEKSEFTNMSKTDPIIDSIKKGVLWSDIPNSINDTIFLSKLIEIDFEPKAVSSNKYQQIRDLFSEKIVFEHTSNACEHIYRDILIFKKKKKTIGIAKVCFSCEANQIQGTKLNTENFGQNGDYKKLYSILYDK